MSLTEHLNDSASPVRQWFDREARPEVTRRLVAAINTLELAPFTPIRGHPSSDPGAVGVAVDYGVRWEIGALEPRAALLGAGRLKFVWPDAEAIVATIVAAGSDRDRRERRARCCIVLAWFEQAYRTAGFPGRLAPWIGRPLESGELRDGLPLVVHGLLASVPAPEADDVAALLITVPATWAGERNQPWIMNPTFAGSERVGGADADWIIGTTLWECKTSGQARPFSRATLLQTLAYALLDRDDTYHLDTLGWYYPRFQARIERDLRGLCGELFSTLDVGSVRERFWNQALAHLPLPGLP